MRKLLILLVLGFFFSVGTTPTSCQANERVRVAVLPVFNSSYTYDQDTERVINESLQARFDVLLAKFIIFYEVIPANEVQLALPPELKNRNKPEKINVPMLRAIGTKLKADIVLGAQITDFRVFTGRDLDDERLKQTDLTIHVVGYDTKKNEFFDIHDREHYNGRWSALGDSDYLAKKIIERLSDKVSIYLETFSQAQK